MPSIYRGAMTIPRRRRDIDASFAGRATLQESNSQKCAQRHDAKGAEDPWLPPVRSRRGVEHARTVPATGAAYKDELARPR
jgi:hypothetical protein